MEYRTWATLLLLLGLALTVIGKASSRPAHKQALADDFGPFLARKLNDCRTCHLPAPVDAPTDVLQEKKPHNAFGKRLAAVKDELRATGKKSTIAARLEAVADEDSDGDGVTNLLELLSGHFPGDPQDKPRDTEITEARKALPTFVKFRSSYPWRPFETVRRPAPPHVKNARWVRNPIDAFISAEHEERGLTPRPEAPRHVQLRRLYLDLIGLPPTREELQAFLSDTSDEAYEKAVDHLLASPRHGERWGRHWMDVWRYSDWAGWTGGNQIRDSQPHIWRWRDWIVEALNHDKGYDRMILEMLAADELAPDDVDALRATGYLARNYKMLSREKWMQDTVGHTAQAFLGVTLGCARCHDHMYDPIMQKEYYQVRAVFEPHNVRIDQVPGQADLKKDGLARTFDANLQAQTFLFIRGDDRTPEKTPLGPGVLEALGGNLRIEEVRLPQAAVAPEKRAFVIQEVVQSSAAAIPPARKALVDARLVLVRVAAGQLGLSFLPGIAQGPGVHRASEAFVLADLTLRAAEAKHAALMAVLHVEHLEDAGKKDAPEWKEAATATATAQRAAAVLEARRNLLTAQQVQRTVPAPRRADATQKLAGAEKALAQAEAAAKAPVSTAYTKRPVKEYPAVSTGRRLAFARWIADRDNPLTARVAMNHVWLRHFGQAIVPSVFDFGRNGRPPSHPALLDWLAAEFMERGWSMKAMHRLIVTSNTYRMAATPDETNGQRDRDNTYYWRMPSRRMEAEVVRDCLFYVAGKLDLTMGGPEIDNQLGLTLPRRSIYFRHAQEKQMEFLKLFDCAEVTECYQRKESVMPQQALALANSALARQHARLVARTLTVKEKEPERFVSAAFEQVLARPPVGAEVSECLAFLGQQTDRYGATSARPAADKGDGTQPSTDPGLRAREDLVHVLFNHNDFVTVR